MSLAFTKLQNFVADIANGVYILNADQLAVALTDVAPTATNRLLSDLTQISYTNLSSRNITTTSSVETSGTYNLKLNSLTLTANGTVDQFQYIVIYDTIPSGGRLIGWFDYGSEVKMLSGDTLPITFDGTNGLLSIA